MRLRVCFDSAGEKRRDQTRDWISGSEGVKEQGRQTESEGERQAGGRARAEATRFGWLGRGGEGRVREVRWGE